MREICNNFEVEKKLILPFKILDSEYITDIEKLMEYKEPGAAFNDELSAKLEQKGAWILLDFGKEICGSIRFITRFAANNSAKIRITFGESVSEACSSIGEKNATNDHSPRDFTATLATLSDLTYGFTGFRFARIELLDNTQVLLQSVYAVSVLPAFKKEAVIKTSDKKLNKIIETAAYTLKLNFQNGYIWDGIKRDRLVWCGDLHQEIVTSLYLFGDTVNVSNSLDFLKNYTVKDSWINMIPTYSAWWVISLCDYCYYTGNMQYFNSGKKFALQILEKIDSSVTENGEFSFTPDVGMPFFLDWPTVDRNDAIIGTAAIFIIAAEKYSKIEANDLCSNINLKLKKYVNNSCEFKQTRAFQILAGRYSYGENEFLEKNGASGFSTFMSYYILKANAISGGKHSLDIIKEYFGGMLSRGATTFWEDFDLDWLEGSSRIDTLPQPGQTDLHGDYGNYCYHGLRHSLCHGWSSGVVAFIIEDLFGIKISEGCKKVVIKPVAECPDFNIKLPFKKSWLRIKYKNGKVEAKAPADTIIIL